MTVQVAHGQAHAAGRTSAAGGHGRAAASEGADAGAAFLLALSAADDGASGEASQGGALGLLAGADAQGTGSTASASATAAATADAAPTGLLPGIDNALLLAQSAISSNGAAAAASEALLARGQAAIDGDASPAGGAGAAGVGGVGAIGGIGTLDATGASSPGTIGVTGIMEVPAGRGGRSNDLRSAPGDAAAADLGSTGATPGAFGSGGGAVRGSLRAGSTAGTEESASRMASGRDARGAATDASALAAAGSSDAVGPPEQDLRAIGASLGQGHGQGSASLRPAAVQQALAQRVAAAANDAEAAARDLRATAQGQAPLQVLASTAMAVEGLVRQAGGDGIGSVRKPGADAERGAGSVFGAGGADASGRAPVDASAFLLPVDAASASAAVGSSGLAERLIDQVSWWMSQKVQGAELKLDVAGHQRVTVSVQIQGNEAHVAFRSDQPEVRAMLGQTMPQLEKMLGQEGLLLSNSSVASHADWAGGRPGADASGEPGDRRARSPAGVGAVAGIDVGGSPASAARAAANARRTGVGAGLDLYV